MAALRDPIGRVISQASKERARDWLLRLATRLPEPVVRSVVSLSKHAARLTNSSRAGAPDSLFFFITNTCNQSCIHCFYAAELNRPQQGMSLDSIRTLCRSLDGKTPTVFLCGGEPTTRPDLPEIASSFIDVARVERLIITTNGLLDKRLFQTIDAALASRRKFQLRIPISLDGPEPFHDTIRKSPGGFRKATATLRRLLEMGQRDARLTPLVTSVIQKSNAEVFVDFYKSIRKTFACEVQFILIRQDNRDAGGLDKTILLDAGNSENLLPDPAVCRRILHEIEQYEQSQRPSSSMPLLRASFAEQHLSIVERGAPVAPCIAPNSFATIFPDGGTSLCELAKPYANVRDFNDDLLACWNSEAANHQRQQLSACWCTYPCALQSSIMRDPDALLKSLRYVRERQNAHSPRPTA